MNAAVLAVLLLSPPASPASSTSGTCAPSLSRADEEAIRTLVERYRTSWLKGDAAGVLATLAPDAVLLPAHGGSPVSGIEAIRRYWWPAGAPPTTITVLDITIEGLAGDCRLAYAHGRDDVAWTVEENGRSRPSGHPGTYLDVFGKDAGGGWRILRHMWDDGTGPVPRPR